ncbi:MAG: hypothetical protein RLZZ459_2269, partial [Cyanobacteriota bacterium]
MTTAEPSAQAGPSRRQIRPAMPRLSHWGTGGPLAAALSLAAVVVGTQTLAASTPLASSVRLLLPSEGLLAGLGDGLRRGYAQAMAEGRA